MISIFFNLEADKTNLSDFLSKHKSKGKNISSLCISPNALESSDSNRSLKTNVSETVYNLAALSCYRNSSTIDGKHVSSGFGGCFKIGSVGIRRSSNFRQLPALYPRLLQEMVLLLHILNPGILSSLISYRVSYF